MARKADNEYFGQQLVSMPEKFSNGLMKFYSGPTVDKSVFEKFLVGLCRRNSGEDYRTINS